MIKISLEQLRNPQFSEAYRKLMNAKDLEPKVAYHIARLGTLIEGEQKIANTAHSKLVEQWAEFKNEDGQTFWKVADEKIEDWSKANKAFHEAAIEIDKNKILLSSIENVGLTPIEYLALEPVINEQELKMLEGGSDGKS